MHVVLLVAMEHAVNKLLKNKKKPTKDLSQRVALILLYMKALCLDVARIHGSMM
jgi:hypothetical protein